MRTIVCSLTIAVLCSGADKKPLTGAGEAQGELLGIEARVYLDKAAVEQVLGAPLEEGFYVVEVKLNPKSDTPLAIWRDDFTLRSDKDGQKSQPFAPSQIAGKGALVITSTNRGGGMVMEDQGPVWGGTMGRPRRLGGDGATAGNLGETGAQATMNSGEKEKSNPLLDVLKAKILPEKETAEPLSGLLYFSLEGKHKLKELELVYKGKGGKMSLRFR